MKRLMISLLGAVAFAAAAQTPSPAEVQSQDTAAATTTKTDAKADDKVQADSFCLQHTGSRIAPRTSRKGQRCVSATGRAYSREDIERTGEINIADALRRLDTSVY